MNAVPMLQRCARHQWPLDSDWPSSREQMLTPNLMLRTGRTHPLIGTCAPECDLPHGMLLPVLTIKEDVTDAQ